MKSKAILFITGAVSAIFGAVIAIGVSDSEAQVPPAAGAKQFQFVATGNAHVGQLQVARYEDIEYEIVCYGVGMGFSCAKK